MQLLTVPTPDGRSLDVAVGGAPAGPLVVLHHGTPSSRLLSPSWEAVAAARGVRLASASRAGYGASTRLPGRQVADAAADCAVVADALGAEELVVIGHSGGGPHALACAAGLPGRVRRCVTVAGVAPADADGLDFLEGMGEDNHVEFAAARAGEAELRTLLVALADDLVPSPPGRFAELLRSLLSGPDLAAFDDALAGEVHASLVAGLAHGVDGWVDDDLAFLAPWGFDLAAIPCAVRVWQGAEDLMVPAAHGEWLAAAIPTATLVRRPQDGHLTPMASGFADVLDDALAG